MSTTPDADRFEEDARRFTLVEEAPHLPHRGYGEYLADRIASVVGSWRFIIVQSTLLLLWICVNVAAWAWRWDPYPFILLNLVLSFQAAFTAPIILMSQNRQSAIDRHKAQLDYDVNLKSELDIEALHEKIDLLRQQEIGRLIDLVERLTHERNREEERQTAKPVPPGEAP